MTEASPALEAFIDESIRKSRESGYDPTVSISMRKDHGTVSAIRKLVTSGDIQSGFKRMSDLGLLDLTIEAAVLRFPDAFSPPVIEAAR